MRDIPDRLDVHTEALQAEHRCLAVGTLIQGDCDPRPEEGAPPIGLWELPMPPTFLKGMSQGVVRPCNPLNRLGAPPLPGLQALELGGGLALHIQASESPPSLFHLRPGGLAIHPLHVALKVSGGLECTAPEAPPQGARKGLVMPNFFVY